MKDLAKKTHRRLESWPLKGLHTGGVCLSTGQRELMSLVLPASSWTRMKRRFSTRSSKCVQANLVEAIAKDSRMVPPSRSKPSHSATWCHTAVREMLKRPLYMGEGLEQASLHKRIRLEQTSKQASPRERRQAGSSPGTRHRASRLVGHGAVPAAMEGNRTKSDLLPRDLTSPYLFSSLSNCGVRLKPTIATSGVKSRKYACAGYYNCGICKNDMYISSAEAESTLVANQKNDLLHTRSYQSPSRIWKSASFRFLVG